MFCQPRRELRRRQTAQRQRVTAKQRLFQLCDDCAFVFQRGLCARERGRVIIEHDGERRVAFTSIDALKVIPERAQLALR
jgi:hypothetical protein